MNGRTLDFAMRVSADLDQAVKEVDGLGGSLDKVKAKGQAAAAGLGAAAGAADKSAEAAKREASAIEQSNARRDRLIKLLGTERGARAQEAEALRRSTAALGAHAGMMGRNALSAGELRNAQRQLPAQITDIVTSLASGQSVFMVAIQQGGQLKDSWGGIMPAARALAGAISPMAIAVTAGAAAFGTMALAGWEVVKQREEIVQTLLATGNYANTSTVEIEALADSLAELDGVTVGGARDALLQVAQSGRFTAEQFELVATAAARMEAATGQSIEDTVQKFEAIGRDPVAALLKLNETEHFLTDAQLERVRALVEEGREQDAAAEGARIYAGRLDEIATAAGAAQPHLSRLWREAKEGASAAWQETKNFAEFLAAAGEQYAKMPWYQKAGPAAGLRAIQAMYNAQPATPVTVPRVAGAVDSKAEEKKEKQRREAEQTWERRQQENLSKRQKLEGEISDIRKAGVTLGKTEAQIAAQIAQARARYAESLPKGKKGGKSEAQQDQEAAQRELENLTKQIELTGTLADGERRVSEEARVTYEIKSGAFRLASEATKQELLAAAKRRDAQLAEQEAEEERRKEVEKTKRAYEQLDAALQTPIEAALADAIAQVKTLNDAMKEGIATAPEYKQNLNRIFSEAFTKAPELRLPNAGRNDITGLQGDQAQIEEQAEELQKWYDAQIELLNQFRAKKVGTAEQWNAEELKREAQHQAALAGLQEAQYDMQVNATQSIFDSMVSIARSAAGEQSKAYRIMFAISKGFAIAQAAVALAQNVAEASKVGFPQNLPLIAAAFAQGAQIASLIAGASFSPQGYADGGYTGPGGKYEVAGTVHKGEGVLNQEDMAALGGEQGFNRFRAALHNGFAEGGIVGEPIYAPAEGRYQPAATQAGGGGPSSVNLRQALYMDRDAAMQAVAGSRLFGPSVLTEIGLHANEVASMLGLK